MVRQLETSHESARTFPTLEALVSRITLPFDLPADQLHITAWHDPVVDALGHDPRSPYVERFWLPLLGPSNMAERQNA